MSDYWTPKFGARVPRRRVMGGMAAGAGLAGLALAGCSSSNNSGSSAKPAANAGSSSGSPASGTNARPATSGTSAPQAQAVASSAAGQPKKGGMLHMMDHIGSDVYDPAITGHAGSVYGGIIFVYEGLNRTTTDFKLEPELAELPEQPDQLTYIYKLRPGVKWQNKDPLNGRAFTAADAAFGIDRFRQPNPEFIYGGRFKPIDKMEAIDANTLKITTGVPFAALAANIAEDLTMMISKEAADKFGDKGLKLFENMIGTGPFMATSFQQGVKATLMKNPTYWNAGPNGKPYIDGFDIAQIADASQRQAALVSGQIDMDAGWGELYLKSDSDQIKAQLGDKLVAEAKHIIARISIFYNAARPPFNDARVRHALDITVDRQAMDAATFKSYSLMGPIHQQIKPYGYTEQQLLTMAGYRTPKDKDIADAKQLLAAAGQGSGLSFHMIGSGALNEIIQQNWKAIGANVTLDALPTAEWLARRAAGNFDIISTQTFDSFDPDGIIYGGNHTDGSANFGKFSDPEVDALAEKQRVTFDVSARKAVTDQAQQKILSLSPQIWTFSDNYMSMWRSWVKNFTVVPGYRGWPWTELWIDKS